MSKGRTLTTEEKIKKAKSVLSRHIRLLNNYDMKAYDLISDDAAITSTRRGCFTLQWKGDRYRELVGPSLKSLKKQGIKGKCIVTDSRIEGEDVLLEGTFEPVTSGQDGHVSLRIGPGPRGRWLIKERHDGRRNSDLEPILKAAAKIANEENASVKIEFKSSL